METFALHTVHNFSMKELLYQYENETNVTVQVGETKDSKEEEAEEDNYRVLFHYYNVQRPVMITYKEQYHIIYYYLDGNNTTQWAKSPKSEGVRFC